MTWLFKSIVLSKKLNLQYVERVMILIFKYVSLHDLIMIWSFIRDCKTSIAFNMIIRINCFIKNCIYKTLERVMIINYFRIDCIIKKIAFVVRLIIKYLFVVRFDRNLIAILTWLIILSKKLHMFCYWLSNTFSLYDLSWFDHSFVIVKRRWRRNIDMIVRINYFVKWITFTKRWTRRDIDIIVRINCIVKKIVLSCSNTFSLYDLFEIWSFFRD